VAAVAVEQDLSSTAAHQNCFLGSRFDHGGTSASASVGSLRGSVQSGSHLRECECPTSALSAPMSAVPASWKDVNDFDWKPQAQGLYDPSFERDSCGVGLITSIDGTVDRSIVTDALKILDSLYHRGGRGCEENTGDGVGMLCGLPDEFFRQRAKKELGMDLPPARRFAVGNVFFAQDDHLLQEGKRIFEDTMKTLTGLSLAGWREVPVDSKCLGRTAKAFEPRIFQPLIVAADDLTHREFEAKLFFLRKKATNAATFTAGIPFYICSLSSRTITYKGMMNSMALPQYYLDLGDADFGSHVALVHSRFSTNTFPAWRRAHPYRYLCHNGEINTIRGNVNWMRAREGVMSSEVLGPELADCFPIYESDQSDSGILDNILEVLHLSGRSLPEAMMLVVPEAWERSAVMSPEKRDMYKAMSSVMEPWDGPAMMAFTDGDTLGACLDRNGLRPARFYVTKGNKLVASSEAGVLATIPSQDVVKKGRLQPGKMFYVDYKEKRIIDDTEFKEMMIRKHPWSEYVKAQITIDDLGKIKDHSSRKQQGGGSMDSHTPSFGSSVGDGEYMLSLTRNREFQGQRYTNFRESTRLPLLRAFGYTQEKLEMILIDMGSGGEEALGSMGNDTPLACLSNQPRQVADFFYQLFAQVTNPPIDPIRESVVMSLASFVGPESNLLDDWTADHCKRLWIEHPCLTPHQMEAIYATGHPDWDVKVVSLCMKKREGPGATRANIERICHEVATAVHDGAKIVVLSDRDISKDNVPVSAMLAVGAVHQHLVNQKTRLRVALVVDSGEPHEVHHHCMMAAYGADAVCPYMAYEALLKLRTDGKLDHTVPEDEIFGKYVKAVGKGMLKVFAKMGVSTLQSYKGAQIAEAIGLSKEVVDVCFTGTPSRVGGLDFAQLGETYFRFHNRGFPMSLEPEDYLLQTLAQSGEYHYRQNKNAETHMNDPMLIAKLQEAARTNSRHAYASFSALHNNLVRKTCLRGQLDFKNPRQFGRQPLPLEAVEPASEIVKRFRTGAMSYGSISQEAHATLALGMNRMGAKSNTGEGGEDPARFVTLENGDTMRSSIKQVASGRFGVTIEYLTNADELQIKMAQGAKPGEGGELPGWKVLDDIAKTRKSTPGVGLISPPPHHDIYSIEDLAQLIFDLKNSNSTADVSVKLVSEVGVGVVAAGVAKCKADHILISGFDGGTGASRWTGIKHAGCPWELGLAETHQTLVLNGLRGRVTLETDGQLRNGRDVVIASLLGAEFFGFATAPLIAMGCIMMRKCHLNTCPVGIATQDPVLRKKFAGQPEHVVNYLMLIAEECRTIMAKLGFRSMDEMIGHAEALQYDKNLKLKGAPALQMLPILMPAHRMPDAGKIGKVENRKLYAQEHFPVLQRLIDRHLVTAADLAFRFGDPCVVNYSNVRNSDRAVGTLLSSELTKRWGADALPAGLVHVKLTGSAGNSLGAFLTKGVVLELEGDSNDYAGKGLSGGALVVYPPKDASFYSEDNIIVGNVCLYGATFGLAFFRGIAAERFAIRNSGAWAVVEGVGDHACEYMTGGRVLVLGGCGTNFGAGMSGGIAWVFDPSGDFEKRCNKEMVTLSRCDKELSDTIPLEREEIRAMLQGHIQFTGSSVAQKVMSNFESSLKHFWRVLPIDFANVCKKKITAGEAPTMQYWKEHFPPEKQVAIPRDTKSSKDLKPLDLGADLRTGDIEDLAKRPTVVEPPAIDQKRGFVVYKRKDIAKRPASERLTDFREITAATDINEVRTQAGRCMDCGTPFCHQAVTDKSGCPLGNLIPEWNALARQGNWQEALRRLLETNNFPEFTGRVCPAPCEGACVLGIIDDPVSIKSVECTIIDKAFENGWMVPHLPPVRTTKTVAIIGSGPAGLAAADQLNKSGHNVTVFERADRPGGLMMYGVPNMKTDKVLGCVCRQASGSINARSTLSRGGRILWRLRGLDLCAAKPAMLAMGPTVSECAGRPQQQWGWLPQWMNCWRSMTRFC